MKRRELMLLAGVTATAGCQFGSEEGSTPQPVRYRLRIQNSDTISHNVKITVRSVDRGEVIFDQTRVLGTESNSLDLSHHLSEVEIYLITVAIENRMKSTVHLFSNASVEFTVESTESIVAHFMNNNQ